MSEKTAHIVTVGTSILGNYRARRGLDRQVLPPETDVFEFVKADPVGASAELAAMDPYLRAGNVQKVYLVYTETSDGTFCGEIVKKYLLLQNIEVGEKPIEGIYDGASDETSQARFLRGLEDLAYSVSKYIRNRQREGLEVFLNATGGYKPETAFLVLIANALRCRVYYRHETMRSTVELPLLLPVKLGMGILELLRGLPRDGKPRTLGTRKLSEVETEAEARKLIAVERDEADGRPYRIQLADAGKLALAVYEGLD